MRNGVMPKVQPDAADSWQNAPINPKAGHSYPQNHHSNPHSIQTPIYSEVP
jgi:hypothetical protein